MTERVTPEGPGAAPSVRTRRLAVSAALFSLATGLSRVLGLVREMVAAALLGSRGVAPNAYTTAGAVPNVTRSLVADAALGAAFVPVFSELLARGERERAWRVASTVLTVATVALVALSALFMAFAEPILRALHLGGDDPELTAQIARILFPTVLLLALSGIVNSMLNAFDEFFVPAIAPVFWNLVIVLFLAAGFLADDARTQVLLYAAGTLVGTVVQFVVPLPWLRGRGGRLQLSWAFRDPAVRRVFALMLPITLGLGLINVNQLVNVLFANVIDPTFAPSAIERAFRVYMLPQGMFSVAVAAVLFPTLARFASAGDLASFRQQVGEGMRQILFLLVPAAAACAVLAEPIVRLLYERGAFTERETPGVAACLAAFALGLAANGLLLLLNRAFFSLQQPWLPTWLALANVGVNALLNLLLYRPFGVWGIPLATSIGNLLSVAVLWALLRRRVGDLELGRTLRTLARIVLAAAALAAVAGGLWLALDALLGRSLPAQLVALGTALVAGTAAYLGASRLLRLTEAELVIGLLRRRMRRTPGTL
jgi:putative peptidoglycan lipid II flippase